MTYPTTLYTPPALLFNTSTPLLGGTSYTQISSTPFNQLLPVLLLIALLIIICSLLTYVERKVLASGHRRIGPNTTGWFGLLQVVADGGKLVVKSILTTVSGVVGTSQLCATVGIVFSGCMLLVCYLLGMVPTSVYYWVVPLSVVLVGHLSLTLIATTRSGSVWTDVGIQRGLALSLCLDTAMFIALLSLLTSDVTTSTLSYTNCYLLAAIVLTILLVLDTGRVPVDLFESESELVCGGITPCGGMYYALLAATEYCTIVVGSLWLALVLGCSGSLGLTVVVMVWSLLLIQLRGLLPRTRIFDVSGYTLTTLLPCSGFTLLLVSSMTAISTLVTLTCGLGLVTVLVTSGVSQLVVVSIHIGFILYLCYPLAVMPYVATVVGVWIVVTILSVLHGTTHSSHPTRSLLQLLLTLMVPYLGLLGIVGLPTGLPLVTLPIVGSVSLTYVAVLILCLVIYNVLLCYTSNGTIISVVSSGVRPFGYGEGFDRPYRLVPIGYVNWCSISIIVLCRSVGCAHDTHVSLVTDAWLSTMLLGLEGSSSSSLRTLDSWYHLLIVVGQLCLLILQQLSILGLLVDAVVLQF